MQAHLAYNLEGSEAENGSNVMLVPNQNVVAQGYVYPADINVNGTHTRVLFGDATSRCPIWLEANVEYAIVILTDDPETSVAVVELGKFDSIHNTWIAKQAYQVGVLLSSSNASTWTAHQELDLSFRLLACRFTETENQINLGTITAHENTDLLTLANIERVSSGIDVEFIYTDSDGKSASSTRGKLVVPGVEVWCEKSIRARRHSGRACRLFWAPSMKPATMLHAQLLPEPM
ncbi:hypothetical protein FACS189449_11800 [Alphaproteobacteria bacterium]|nr:hypothetical protein FACS189449_11800 [Alphaproteobacteria bacterium]